jgi:hypothetical protein
MPTVPVAIVDRSRLESKVGVRVQPGGLLVGDPMESIELWNTSRLQATILRLCCRIGDGLHAISISRTTPWL